MSTGNSSTVPIAPSANNTASANNTTTRTRSVASTDIVFVDGQAFNGRGFRVCGVANQRGTLCGRIGSCPFHAGKTPGAPTSGRVPKRRRTNSAEPGPPVSTSVLPSAIPTPLPAASQPQLTISANQQSRTASLPDGVRRMDAPPTKGRFKRSWTPAEHRQFLASMKKFGKGKWKEIAREVKTRTANQCQSHAQKYFLRQAKSDSERKKKSIHDLTEVDEVPQQQQSRSEAGPSSNTITAPKLEPLPTPSMPAPLPSPPPPVQSPTVYFSGNPSSLPIARDKHPAISNVDTLASAALSIAPGSDDAVRNVEHSKVTAMVNAALKNATSTPLSNATVSEGASHVSSVREEKAIEGEGNENGTAIEDGEQLEAPVSGDGDGYTTNSASASIAAAVHAAANVQMQALAQAAQVALVTGANKGNNDSSNKDNGAVNVNGSMMSALQAQLMSNPQALMLLNPILANINGLNSVSNGGTTAIAPPQRLRVTVHVNGKKGGGMALVLPESNDKEEFFKMAQNVLNHGGSFRRVFTRSGGEITSLDQMVQDDALWLSEGEDFATPWPR